MAHQEIKAVEMTRQIRDRIYEQVKDLSPAEQLAFYRERARLMDAKAEKLWKKDHTPAHA